MPTVRRIRANPLPFPSCTLTHRRPAHQESPLPRLHMMSPPAGRKRFRFRHLSPTAHTATAHTPPQPLGGSLLMGKMESYWEPDHPSTLAPRIQHHTKMGGAEEHHKDGHGRVEGPVAIHPMVTEEHGSLDRIG
ncbi:hypothetical protein FRC02_007308 [Tulasnella sp. 418]|nr:hypothetical protein FRC02_007308 [Tulasnella sp. 418]